MLAEDQRRQQSLAEDPGASAAAAPSRSHASLRRLLVTSTSLVEKKLDTHETVVRLPLSYVARVVRFADEPMKLAVEWADLSLPPFVYVTSDRDAMLCALLDAAQGFSGRCIPVVPQLTERGDAIVSWGNSGGWAPDAELERAAVGFLAAACKEAVDKRALTALPLQVPSAAEDQEVEEVAAAAASGRGLTPPRERPPGEVADSEAEQGIRERSSSQAAAATPSATAAPTAHLRRLKLPKSVEQAVARTVNKTVKKASSVLQRSGIKELLGDHSQAKPKPPKILAGLEVARPAGEDGAAGAMAPPWALGGQPLELLLRRVSEFNATVAYTGIRPSTRVDDATVSSLFALLPAAGTNVAMELDPEVSARCSGILSCLTRLAASLAVAQQVCQGAAVFLPKILGMLTARDAGVSSEAARLLTRLWAPGPSRVGAVVWAHPRTAAAEDGGLHAAPTGSLGLNTPEDAASARATKQALLSGKASRDPVSLTSRTVRSLFTALDGGAVPGRGVASASPLVCMFVVEAVASAMCIPGAQSTEPAALAELVQSCSGLGRGLFHLFNHPARRVSDSVAVIMTTVVAQGGAQIAAPMREAALKEGSFLMHLHQALFGSGARMGLSQGLVALWADEYRPALSCLKRILPIGLIRFLTPKPHPVVAPRALSVHHSSPAPPSPSAGAAAAAPGTPGSSSSSAAAAAGDAPGSAGRPEPSVASVLRLNWDGFFESALSDHSDAALLWNERTRQELRSALEEEVQVLRLGRARAPPGSSPTWNYQEFIVRYPTLDRELCIGGVYVRQLMSTAVKAAASGSEVPAIDDTSATEAAIQPAIERLADPRAFFNALYHQLLTSALEADGGGGIEDSEERVLCIRAMAAVYRVHAWQIGPFDGVKFVAGLADSTPSSELRLHLLRLLDALVVPSSQQSLPDQERTLQVASTNALTLVESGHLEMLVEGSTFVHMRGTKLIWNTLHGSANLAWPDDDDDDVHLAPVELARPAEEGEMQRQWLVLAPASEADVAAAEAGDGSSGGGTLVHLQGRALLQQGPMSLPALAELLRAKRVDLHTLVYYKDDQPQQPRPLLQHRLLRWLLGSGSGGLLGFRECAALADTCWHMVEWLATSQGATDTDGDVYIPLPKVHRILAGPACLPHLCQLLLADRVDLVPRAGAVLHRILPHNPAAISKLYATGLFYFALALEGGVPEELAKVLQASHTKQRFRGEADALAENRGACPCPAISNLDPSRRRCPLGTCSGPAVSAELPWPRAARGPPAFPGCPGPGRVCQGLCRRIGHPRQDHHGWRARISRRF